MALDGQVVVVAPAGVAEAELAITTAGRHRVSVRPLLEGSDAPSLFGDDPYGSRVHLDWRTAVSSGSIAGWNIYWDGGTGTIGYASPYATIRDLQVEQVLRKVQDSGSSIDGVLSFLGAWSGPPDLPCRIGVTISDGFLFSAYLVPAVGEIGSGIDLIEDRPFRGGDEIELGYGVRVRFDSPTDAYAMPFPAATAVWNGPRVRPSSQWTSGELAPGTYRFALRTVDTGGNISISGIERSVRIWGRAPSPVNPRATWDGDEITVAWTNPAGAKEELMLLSNFNQVTGRLEEAIIEDVPLAWLDWSLAQVYSFTPPVDGLWRFYLRFTHPDHRGHSDDIALLEVNTEAIPTAAALREPEGLTVSPAPGGAFTLRWRYPLEGGQDVAQFNVYEHDDEESPNWAEIAYAVDPDDGIAQTRPYLEMEFTTDPAGGDRWYTVRAADDDGNETRNSELVFGRRLTSIASPSGTLRGCAT